MAMQATDTPTRRLADFIAATRPPAAARQRAAVAFCDTVGVMLAGVPETAATLIRSMAAAAGPIGQTAAGPCRILGTADRGGPEDAALANGVAAHALDYDDMCFVSLAHPSCALVPAALAAGELTAATGRTLLDAYIAGFEIECRLGSMMNPRHYHQRGWHCTSSIGTVGAAAAAARVLNLTAPATMHALGIAASLAGGLKENLGTMVKPLHAGMAARNGVMAARLAGAGFTASEQAIDGPQGYLAAMDSEHPAAALSDAIADLGSRWEILDTGITVKLYPSCAATHPPLDVLLDLRHRHGLAAEDIAAIDVDVDSMTPRLLIHERPSTALEAKFSMPFCAAAAMVFGHPAIDTFAVAPIGDARVQALLPRVTLRANPAFDAAAPLSQARVTIRLHDGRTFAGQANGARGYPGRLSTEELETKFLACARRSLAPAAAAAALAAVRAIEENGDVRTLTEACATKNSMPGPHGGTNGGKGLFEDADD
ncbi:MAG: MmgE/PrpD family protein [Acidobacteriota bacterium]